MHSEKGTMFLDSKISVHRGGGPYSCDVCNKIFSYASQLKSSFSL
jgi:hypothetical protein